MLSTVFGYFFDEKYPQKINIWELIYYCFEEIEVRVIQVGFPLKHFQAYS